MLGRTLPPDPRREQRLSGPPVAGAESSSAGSGAQRDPGRWRVRSGSGEETEKVADLGQ